MTQRMTREDRHQWLVERAAELATKIGYSNLTRENICAHAGVSRALVNQYFMGGITEVKNDVVDFAVSTRNARLVAEAILFKHPNVPRGVKVKMRDDVIAVLYPPARGGK